jgi:hypothetical protein
MAIRKKRGRKAGKSKTKAKGRAMARGRARVSGKAKVGRTARGTTRIGSGASRVPRRKY